MGKKKKKDKKKKVNQKSPYKHRRIIEHFMADAGIVKGKHINYVILMEDYQMLTSRDAYNIKFKDRYDARWVKVMWPKELPKLIHRSKLRGILGVERAKIYWRGSGSTRL